MVQMSSGVGDEPQGQGALHKSEGGAKKVQELGGHKMMEPGQFQGLKYG